MKLRIAHVDDKRRMAGKFVVQQSFFGLLWDDMYFNPNKKILQEEFSVGGGALENVVKASFDDFHEATKYARIFKKEGCRKQIIRETWKV